MISGNTTVQFETAIRKALGDFNHRVGQLRSFETQNSLLKRLHEQVKRAGYCHSRDITDLSLEYEDFYNRLSASGRSYENIVYEKNLVDAYSAFEKFLFDCFCAIYTFFPKYLGAQKSISVSDLFIGGDIELCKKNIVELEVKSFVQSQNIIGVIEGFNKKFHLDLSSVVSKDDKKLLFELSLLRNLLIHNNGVVNRVYSEAVKDKKGLLKGQVKYPFREGETVLSQSQLHDLVEDIKDISVRVSEKMADAIIGHSTQLERHHENMQP